MSNSCFLLLLEPKVLRKVKFEFDNEFDRIENNESNAVEF